MRLLLLSTLALAACNRSAPPAGAPVDCAKLSGDNAVKTEMRILECALERTVVAIGRDDLAAIPEAIESVHAARQETEHALESGAYQPAGDRAAFVELDEGFHRQLEALLEAARAGDAAAAGAALGGVMAACQGCHATFRPQKPPPR